MGRTLIVGDVHACRVELEALLNKAAFTSDDALVLTGDLVVRGPDPRGVLEVARRHGARSVRGNHEERLLRYWKNPVKYPLGDYSRETAEELGAADWAFLDTLPLWLDLPSHGIRVVHGGVVPGIPIEQQDPQVVMSIRSLDKAGAPLEGRGAVLWGEKYEGPPHVVFGHNAQNAPQLHPWATGLDTGCVYGGHLTGMLLEEGQAPPPVADREDVLLSVRAKKRYAGR